MSKPVDLQRRNLLKLSGGLTLVVTSSTLFADVISDKILADNVNQIISVRIWPSDVYTRLTIEAEQAIKAKYFNLTNPTRFVIDIENANLNAVLKNLSSTQFANDPMISGIKVGQFTPTTIRIVIYARQAVAAQTQTAAPVSLGSVNYKYRYVFDMYPASGKKPANEDALDDQLLAFLQLNSAQPESLSQALKQRQLDTPKIVAASAGTTRQTITKGKLLVMIDPGHGGEDPGAIGPQGTKEKHIVLDISQRLYALINDSNLLQAQLTRSQDIFIPLGTRVAIARKAKADIFVSVHADAFTSPLARGSSVFVLSANGASSAFAKYMAASQNNADLIGGMTFKTKDSIVNRILLDMTQGYTMRKSTRLGGAVLGQLKTINKLHSNELEHAGFAVLKAPDIPSILVESAFVSNPIEEELLKTAAFRQQVAQQVYDGLQLYAQQNYNLLSSLS